MRWRYAQEIDLGGTGRIDAADARRQRRTTVEILRRLGDRPGVVLADEVGMGKTFVALAVAVSAIESLARRQPVVVMVPPAVAGKWPKEWQVFEEKCRRGDLDIRVTDHTVASGAAFLKLLDDRGARRHDLIFLTHGALTRSLGDPYIRLAIVRRALQRTSLSDARRAFPRWAGRILIHREFEDVSYVRALLDANPRSWLSIHRRRGGMQLGDDPVPAAFLNALTSARLNDLVDVLRTMPLRESAGIDGRLKKIRFEINAALQPVWKDCLARLRLSLPLLILDEAHHLKNPGTRLAGLFDSPEAAEDISGPFADIFQRMLFLTATPFQLGHRELIQVLRRFEAVRWASPGDRGRYQARIDELERALDVAQHAALRLDSAWGRLEREDVTEGEWWHESGDGLSEGARRAAVAFSDAEQRLREAERLLRPWVIRHARPDRDKRRTVKPGRAISGADAALGGLEVAGASVLPFLLAARMQAAAAVDVHRSGRNSRAYFAEGLASSYEAYRETRLDADSSADGEAYALAAWYAKEISRALPTRDESYGASHPKIRAVVNRVADLWCEGEKALVFCFFVRTGRALRTHISAEVRKRILDMGAVRLGLVGVPHDEIANRLRLRSERFFDQAAPVTQAAHATVSELLRPSLDDPELHERATTVVLKFVRTPVFLARYVDLASQDTVGAFEDALTRSDGSGRSLRERIERFGEYLAARIPFEREELLLALEEMPSGAELVGSQLKTGREAVFPAVRLANGEVAQQTRRRLMLAFNSPFFPDVLIASSVMAEGVDLQTECRYVIHHDLDWNPSVLEQRTGRVDRLGSKAQHTGLPIVIFEPFVGGTQDEKQFRVVKDRERWFNVVMGERLQLDEWSTDKIAERVPLPAAAAAQLTFRLSVA